MQISMREIAGFLLASRIPNLIIIGYVQFGTAFFLMNKPWDELLTIPFGLLILTTTMVGSAGYIINDYFDQKIDMINRPDRVIIGDKLRRRRAITIHFLLSAGAIALALVISPLISLVHLFSTTMLLMYSSFLKRMLLVDTLIISFLTGLTLLLVLIFFQEVDLLVFAYAVFGGIAIFIRESMKDIISTKGDKTFGLNSISSKLGMRKAKNIIYPACLTGTFSLGYYLLKVPNWNIRYFFAVILVFIAWFTYRLYRADKIKEFQELKYYVDLIIIAGLISIIFS